MNRTARSVFLFAALLGMAACSADVGGSWLGSWAGDNSGGGSMTLQLSQSGTSVYGEAVVSGQACLPTGTVSGSMDGDKLGATIQSGSVTMTLTGTVSDDDKTVGGTYAFKGGQCDSQTGTWSVSKQ